MRILIDKFIQRCLCVSSMAETIENKQSHFDEKVLYYCYFLFTQQIYPKCLCLSSMVEKIENKTEPFLLYFQMFISTYSTNLLKMALPKSKWLCSDTARMRKKNFWGSVGTGMSADPMTALRLLK